MDGPELSFLFGIYHTKTHSFALIQLELNQAIHRLIQTNRNVTFTGKNI